MGWGWGGAGRRATVVWISAAAGGVKSAAARASKRSGAGLGGWGVRPRGSASACAFGGWDTPGLLVRLERRASGEAVEVSACFAARSSADGESSETDATKQLPTRRQGLEQGSTAVGSYSLLLPSRWPVQRTFKMLMILNKGLVGVLLKLYHT